MSRPLTILRRWLPLAVVIIGLCGLVYVAVQQVLRQGANDPQIQLAEDAAAALAHGAAVAEVVPATKVDLPSGLAPFVLVFDDAGKAVAGSGELHGTLPTPPPGVLEHVRSGGENRVTWQPEPGVRIAAVAIHYGGAHPGFVLAGRSLREVEAREAQTEFFAGAAMALLLAASLVTVALGAFLPSGQRPR